MTVEEHAPARVRAWRWWVMGISLGIGVVALNIAWFAIGFGFLIWNILTYSKQSPTRRVTSKTKETPAEASHLEVVYREVVKLQGLLTEAETKRAAIAKAYAEDSAQLKALDAQVNLVETMKIKLNELKVELERTASACRREIEQIDSRISSIKSDYSNMERELRILNYNHSDIKNNYAETGDGFVDVKNTAEQIKQLEAQLGTFILEEQVLVRNRQILDSALKQTINSPEDTKATRKRDEGSKIPPHKKAKVSRRDWAIAASIIGLFGILIIGVVVNEWLSRPTIDDVEINVAGTAHSTRYPLTFSDRSDLADAKYAWELGDGTTSNLANVIHQYKMEGQYNLTLIVQDKRGNQRTLSESIAIAYEPWVGWSPSRPTPGSTVTFQGITEGSIHNVTSATLMINGHPATNLTATHVFPHSGKIPYQIEVTLENGETKTTTGRLDIPLSVSINRPSNRPVEGESVRFTASVVGSDGPTSVTWRITTDRAGEKIVMSHRVGDSLTYAFGPGSFWIHAYATGPHDAYGTALTSVTVEKKQEPKVSKPDSRVSVSKWTNDANHRLEVLAGTWNGNNPEDFAQWTMAPSSSSGFFFNQDLACSRPQSDIHFAIYTMDDKLVNQRSFTVQCNGSAGYELFVTSSGALSLKQIY